MKNKKHGERLRKWWTEEEINYLEEKWGNMPVKAIAKNLSRSVKSVKIKAARIGIGSFFEAGNLVLLKDIILTLGYTYSGTIVRKFERYGMPIQRIKSGKRSCIKIDLDDFWEWAEKNQDVITFKNFEKNALGIEPEWVDKKRVVDRKTPKKNFTNWTKEEERLLISKAKSGRYNLFELSVEFNRSEAAIRMKLFNLGCRTTKKREVVKYSEEEKHKILKLKEEGYDFTHISRELKRSELGVIYQYKTLIGA